MKQFIENNLVDNQIYDFLDWGLLDWNLSEDVIGLWNIVQLPTVASSLLPDTYQLNFDNTVMDAAKPNTQWHPAHSSNYSNYSGNRESDYDIDYIIIHIAEGTALGTVNWFQNSTSNVSAHYTVADDGTIYQSVDENDIAWHAGNWAYNTQSIGIEHEGYGSDPNSWTTAEYQASAELTRWLSETYNIPMDRNHIIGHHEVPGSSSVDPGAYFDWNYYMDLVTQAGGDPDLIADNFTVNTTTIDVNGTLDFDWEIENIGSGDMTSSAYAGVYLSTNSTISLGDTLLHDETFSVLNAGERDSNEYQNGVVLPTGLAPGTYWVGVIADNRLSVTESDENNNVSNVIQITVTASGPAYEFSILAVSLDDTTIVEGSDTTLRYTITNTGTQDTTAAVYQGFWASTDTVFGNSDDIFLESDGAGFLSSGEVNDQNDTLGDLANLSSGIYYIFTMADYQDDFVEGDETNNVSNYVTLTITGIADLTISNVTLDDTTITEGGQTTINFTVSNIGSADAFGVTQAIYISTDNIYDSGDTQIDLDSAGTVTAGEVDSDEFRLLDELSTYSAGTYYLFVVADYNDSTPESDETNNVSGPVQITIESASLFTIGDDTITLPSPGTYDALAGNDNVTGTSGSDIVFGNDGEDVLKGLGGSDVLSGGADNDTLYGQANNDDIFGGDGDDTIFGGLGDDLTYGNAGDDFMNGQAGNDLLEGGDGMDTMLGASGDDILNGGNDNDNINGNGGNDTINGGDGNDILGGAVGFDTINAGRGDDTISGGNQNDTLNGDAGNDTINGDAGNDVVHGGSGDDILVGASGADTLIGFIGDDSLSGGSGGDDLFGGDGNDTLDGGGGNDNLNGGAGLDVFLANLGFRTDRIQDFEDGIDQIDFSRNSLANSFADVIAAATQVGANVRIDLNANNILILQDFNLADLDVSDFTF